MEAGKNVGSGFRIGTAWLLAALVALVMPFGLRAAPAGVPAEVTFTKDIAPLVQRSCENCHRPGGVAPMSLGTYEDASDIGAPPPGRRQFSELRCNRGAISLDRKS